MNNLRKGFSILTKEDLYYDGFIDSMEECEICETTGEIIANKLHLSWDDALELAY